MTDTTETGYEMATLEVMEALPMTVLKNVAARMEFLITFAVSTLAGLLAFLVVLLVTFVLGLYQA